MSTLPIAIFRLKQEMVNQSMISVSYMGEVVNQKDGFFHLQNTVIINEVFEQTQNPVTKQAIISVKMSYQSHTVFSNGTLQLREEGVLWTREVDSTDEVLIGYRDALKALYEEQKVLQKRGLIHGVEGRA